MSNRPTLHLKQPKPATEASPAPEQQTTPKPRSKPARYFPWTSRENPEQDGVVSLARAAKVATRTEWGRLLEGNCGKILNAMQSDPRWQTSAGIELQQRLAEFWRANDCSISTADCVGGFLPDVRRSRKID